MQRRVNQPETVSVVYIFFDKLQLWMFQNRPSRCPLNEDGAEAYRPNTITGQNSALALRGFAAECIIALPALFCRRVGNPGGAKCAQYDDRNQRIGS
jgi:hypothetical protein